MRRALALSLALVCAGCGGGSSSHPAIAVTPRDGLIDAAPRVRISDAPAGAVLRATTSDARGRRWTSRTPLAAVRRDPSAPLWSMRHGTDVFISRPSGFAVRFDLLAGGRSLAHTTIRRLWSAAGVHHEAVRHGLYGEVFDPAGSGRRAAALVIGGSEGGLSTAGEAALLASHGYPALALAYFREPGLPATLKDIPLEYFARALRRLRARPDVDPRRVAVIGTSRGGEGALLIGATYPRLVHGVVALVPSDVVQPSPDRHSAAWTLHGRALAHIAAADFRNPDPSDEPEAFIRAERIAGPILTVSGGDDALWPSSAFATVLHQRLAARHFAHPHQDLQFADAGHLVGSAVPDLPAAAVPEYGGSPRADAAGRAAAWPRILEFMRGLGGD